MRMTSIRWKWIPLVLFLICAGVDAHAATFQSGSGRAVFLEIFTSEGCSSCPPAEEWLSGLKNSPSLWSAFVPVAFHVDYWNSLGWEDTLSLPVYSQRQRSYASQWRSSSVYTPMLVNNGMESRQWQLDPLLKTGREEAGTLKVEEKNPDEFEVTFLPACNVPFLHVSVNAASLGFDIVIDVKSGENAGKTLRHDFAVLSWAKKETIAKNGIIKTVIRFDSKVPAAAARHAIAVWVTDQTSGRPLQATGGFLD